MSRSQCSHSLCYQSLLEESKHLDVSLSMSFTYHKPSTSPMLGRTPSPFPSFEPSPKPFRIPDDSQSRFPHPPSHQSIGPSVISVTSILPTTFLSMTPESPTVTPTRAQIGIYECSDRGVVRVDTAASETTLIKLSVAYAAEVSGTRISVTLLDKLELIFLESAIAAALGCAPYQLNRQLLQERDRSLLTSTEHLGRCNDAASKTYIESELTPSLQVCARRRLKTPHASFWRLS